MPQHPLPEHRLLTVPQLTCRRLNRRRRSRATDSLKARYGKELLRRAPDLLRSVLHTNPPCCPLFGSSPAG